MWSRLELTAQGIPHPEMASAIILGGAEQCLNGEASMGTGREEHVDVDMITSTSLLTAFPSLPAS